MSSCELESEVFYVDWRKRRRWESTYVEGIKLGNAVLSNQLRDGRIALAHPSEEFRDTCLGGLAIGAMLVGRQIATNP